MDSFVDLVIVTYLPNRDQLLNGINSLKDQVRNIILVSNSLDNFEEFNLPIIHIALGKNRGIGMAQNIGIRKALELNADWVLTSDQDTVYPENYVEEILEVYKKLSSQTPKIAALGPVFKDENHFGKIHDMVNFGRFGLKKIDKTNFPTSVSHFIASGMMIPKASFQHIGFMNEDFFMDWVDTEWCWRAKKIGYELIQIPTLIVSHQLGISTQSYLGISITTHSQIREFYKIRNAILLLFHSSFTELSVRSYLGIFTMKNIFINFLKGFRKLIYFKIVFLSITHGLMGKPGKVSI